MKKEKKYSEDLIDVAFAGFLLGISFTFFLLKSIVDSRKKEKINEQVKN
jgi:hypothetical protein